MAHSLQELQRNALMRMLNLDQCGVTGGIQLAAPMWKVLVCDKACMDVITPVLTVGTRHKCCVTLLTTVTATRQPMPDVPAVYFIEPTAENVARLRNDFERRLNQCYYINFAGVAPHSLLVELAKAAMQTQATQRVTGVFDRLLCFASLSPSLFSLNLPDTYELIYSRSEQLIRNHIGRVADGLLSVLVTMRMLPIIRCPPGDSPAQMLAHCLHTKIQDILARKDNSVAELFSREALGSSCTSNERPLLCILDRNLDLASMLSHTWNYQSMVHDILDLRLNIVKVPVKKCGDEANATDNTLTTRSYDVGERDSFWLSHASTPFPDVMEAAHAAMKECAKRVASAKSVAGDFEALGRSVNNLPETLEMKRANETHVNIVTALLDQVQQRGLDHYSQVEGQFRLQSSTKSIAQVKEVLMAEQKGTVLDKTRALLVLYLLKKQIPPAQLEELCDALRAIGGDTSCLDFVQKLVGSQHAVSHRPPTECGAFQSLRNTTMNAIKDILPIKKESTICQVLEELMESRADGVTANYLHIDPKAPLGTEPKVGAAPRKTPRRSALVFVLGGGNYAEMLALQDWAQEHQRHVVYGATELLSPEQFVQGLCRLGRA